MSDEKNPATSYQPRIADAARAFHERMFPGYVSDFLCTDPEFIERFDNFAFDEVLAATPELDDRTRAAGWLASLLGCQGIDEFRAMVPAALELGMEPAEVKEIVYQAVAYLGIGRVFPFLKAANEVLESRGVELPLAPRAKTEPTRESRLAGGEAAQVEIFGESMRGYKDKGNPDYPHINEWLVANCFGDYYARGVFDLAERELATFCLIAAQGGCDAQLRAHVAANLSAGNPRKLMIALISSNLPFIGYPRTLNALAALDSCQ